MRAKEIIALILFCVAMPGTMLSQDNLIKETFDDAEYFFQLEDYPEALINYQKIFKKGYQANANINYRIGVCYLNLNFNREKAVEHLEVATKSVSEKYVEGSLKEETAPQDAWLYLGNAYRIAGKLSEAIEAYEIYNRLTQAKPNESNQFANTEIEACKRYTVAKQKSQKVVFSNIGTPINNKEANYNPLMSADGKTLVFMTHTKFYEAIMISRYKDGAWQSPDNLNPDIMSDGDQFVSYLSPDAKTLLLAKQDNFNCDIFISKFENNRWTPSVSAGKEINTKFWEAHACLSPDGKTMYFVSNREGTIGNTDLWTATKNDNGEWTNVQNMKALINTNLNEETPFISPDGKRLYFSSQGHNSIGGYDIYYTDLLANGNWSEPVNMGYPVNTTDDDLYYSPTADKNIAYKAMYSKSGLGDLDIYKIELFNAEHPYDFKIVGNFTKGLEKLNFADYTITLVKAPDTNLSSQIASDSGTYAFKSKAGKYAIRFYTSDFVYVSPFFEIPQNYENDTYLVNSVNLGFDEAYNKFNTEKQSRLANQRAKSEIIVRDILFDFNSFSMMPAAEKEIANIASILQQFKKVKLTVTGHTDGLGGAKINLRISLKRAKMVKDMLVNSGIEAQRIKIYGKGKSKPIAINQNPDKTDSPQGRAYNRRVEFGLMNNPGDSVKIEHITVPDELKKAVKAKK